MRSAFALLALGLVLPLAVVVSCDAATEAGVTDVSAEELLATEPGSALILDVRTPEEFAAGHVPGAVNISHDALAERVGELGSDTGRPVVVYCERGGRAGMAADVLLAAGFSDVRHLAGDMSAWREAGHPTERPPDR